jgi:hypothetical protein
VRRRLEKKLGSVSPSDVSAELAAWFWDRQVFETREDETVVRVASSAAPRFALRPWLVPTVGAALIAGLTALFFLLPLRESSLAQRLAPDLGHSLLPQALLQQQELARLHFDADGNVQVKIDDQQELRIDKAQGTLLSPGPHRFEFTHPAGGEQTLKVKLAAGEVRTLSPSFE